MIYVLHIFEIRLIETRLRVQMWNDLHARNYDDTADKGLKEKRISMETLIMGIQ